MTDAQALQLVERLVNGGAYGLLVLAVVAGWRGWYVWRWVYDKQVEETAKAIAAAERWEAVAMKALGVTESIGSIRP